MSINNSYVVPDIFIVVIEEINKPVQKMTHHIRSRSNRTGPGNNLRHNIVVLERLRDRWRRMRIEAELRPPLVVVRRGYWHLKTINGSSCQFNVQQLFVAPLPYCCCWSYSCC